jgi:hypothetical protein
MRRENVYFTARTSPDDASIQPQCFDNPVQDVDDRVVDTIRIDACESAGHLGHEVIKT